MTVRDPNKTARNRTIQQFKEDLRSILDHVLLETGKGTEASLNAFIGQKIDHVIDLKHEIIKTPEEYIDCWIKGLDANKSDHRLRELIGLLENKGNKYFRKYVLIFLKRSFLNHYEELYKTRPNTGDSEIWFGVNDAYYGFLVTPRFANGNWENDKSEIRHSKFLYWTIGHALEVGFCIPGKDARYSFTTIDDLYNFLFAQVRLTKSQYQERLMELYVDFVRSSKLPDSVPLLIPEIRFSTGVKHEHRLDFLIINPFTMEKLGIELSPWSTHGKIVGREKTLKVINAEAQSNFEYEMLKIKKYFKKYKIPILHFTDSDIVNMQEVFDSLKAYLNPGEPPRQLQLHSYSEYFD